MNRMNATHPSIFTQHWYTYQKLIKENYMLHSQWEQLTTATLRKHFSTLPFHLLDLGCGDALPLLPCLKGQPMISYTGVDLSGPALDLARKHLSTLPAFIQLKETSIENYLSECHETYDLIYSSYSIHHLDDETKKSVFSKCYDLLKPKGRIIYIDIYREEQISLASYRNRYTSMVEQEWNILDPEEKKRITEHLTACDFPAVLTEMKDWFTQIGFEIEGGITRDQFHCMIVLRKAMKSL